MTVPFSPATRLVLALAATVVISSPAWLFAGSRSGRATPERAFGVRVDLPPTPVAVEGRLRLVHELHLTNSTGARLIPSRVEILESPAAERTGRVIGEFRGEALALRLMDRAAPSGSGDGSGMAASRSIAPGGRGVIYLELTLDGEPPRALEHRVEYHAEDGDPAAGSVVQGGRVEVRRPATSSLGPPLRGRGWAAVHHPCWTRGHRRVFFEVDGHARIPGRFAVDWIRLDDDGRVAAGDRDVVANWHGYGADVLAVADAVVAATRDDLGESATISGRSRPPLDESEGNRVVLDLGDGRFAFYGHLRPGSVRVRPGERVRRGQVIGAVGFSGSAGGPQLHFHVADAPSSPGGEGLPFELESFQLLGSLAPADQGNPCDGADRVLQSLGEARWTPRAGSLAPQRVRELPAPNAVVEFGSEH